VLTWLCCTNANKPQNYTNSFEIKVSLSDDSFKIGRNEAELVQTLTLLLRMTLQATAESQHILLPLTGSTCQLRLGFHLAQESEKLPAYSGD
jgi:hypothetical protein